MCILCGMLLLSVHRVCISCRHAMVSITTLADWRLSDEDFLKAFEIFGTGEKFSALRHRNTLAREDRIIFHDGPHAYEVDGVRVPRSVTSLVHSYCPAQFDPEQALLSMNATRRSQFINKLDGSVMSNAEVLAFWDTNGKVARARGTLLHYHAEAYCNDVPVEHPHSPEFKMVMCLIDTLQDMGFKPYRTEACLIHIGLCCAGQTDALFIDDNCGLALVDWKRSVVTFDKCYRSLLPPLEHIPDCNGYIYMLQLGLYKYICESEYGMKIDTLFLGVVHPSQNMPRLVRMPDVREEIELIVEDQLSKGLAVSAAKPGATAPFQIPVVYDEHT